MEVRKLPNKQYSEQYPRTAVKRSRCRYPSDHWWNRPGKRADERSPHGAFFQRSVRQQVTQASCHAESRRQRACRHIQIQGPGNCQRNAKDQRFARLQYAAGQWSQSRAPHVAVGLALDVVIQRRRARRYEHRSENRVQHMQPRDGAARSHIVSGRRCHQHEEGNVRLRQGDVAIRARGQCQFRGARCAHPVVTCRDAVAATSLLHGTSR